MELLQLNNQSTTNLLFPTAVEPAMDDFDLEEYISAEYIDMPSPVDDLDRFLASLFPPPYRSHPVAGADGPKEQQQQQEEPERPVKRGRPRKDSDTEAPLSTTTTTQTTSPPQQPDKTRRERNRLAAQRCRERRLARVEELELEVERLRQEKEAMMAELIRLGARPPS